jgi:hypothetical protein
LIHYLLPDTPSTTPVVSLSREVSAENVSDQVDKEIDAALKKSRDTLAERGKRYK